MTVVRNEFEMGESDPIGVTTERLQAVAFDWHNYGKSTIGARSDIEQVNIPRLRAFYKNYYQPDNAVLMVAGRFDEAKVLKQVNEQVRTHSEAGAHHPADLHRRTNPGRRALGHRAPQRRHPVRRRRLPRRAVGPCRRGGAVAAVAHPGRRAERPPAQGAGRNQARHQGAGRRRQQPGAKLPHLRRRGAEGRERSTRPRTRCSRCWKT